MKNPKARKGSTLGSLFEELGETSEFRARVQKALLADQLREEMKNKQMTPADVARRAHTSRQQIYRVLDPAHTSHCQLGTLQRVSECLGLSFEVVLRRLPVRRPARTTSFGTRRGARAAENSPRYGRRVRGA